MSFSADFLGPCSSAMSRTRFPARWFVDLVLLNFSFSFLREVLNPSAGVRIFLLAAHFLAAPGALRAPVTPVVGFPLYYFSSVSQRSFFLLLLRGVRLRYLICCLGLTLVLDLQSRSHSCSSTLPPHQGSAFAGCASISPVAAPALNFYHIFVTSHTTSCVLELPDPRLNFLFFSPCFYGGFSNMLKKCSMEYL
jgi:hypothetical protein